MKLKITTRVVEGLCPGGCVFDSELRGFAVRCQKSANVKTYFLKTTVEGRQKLVTIGQHGNPWTPATARQFCQKLIGEKVSGSNLNRRRLRNVTVAEAADEFLDLYVRSRLAVRTQREYADHVKLFIKPMIGEVSMRGLEYGDAERIHASLRNKPVRANRVRSTLSRLCSWAELKGYRPKGTNPVVGLPPYEEHPRERFLTDAEIKRVGLVMINLFAAGGVSHHALAAIQLLLLTGCRSSEIQTLKWSYVDTTARVIRLPRRKSGDGKVIYLNDAALTVLEQIALFG